MQILPTPGSSSPSALPVDELVGRVAAFVGEPDDPDARSLALDCLDQAAGDLNLAGTYLWTLRETSPTLIAASRTVGLPADWGWPYGPARLVDAEGHLKNTVDWLPWDQFWKVAGAQLDLAETGAPLIGAIRGEGTSDWYAYLHPIPDASTAADHTLTAPYLARIQRPSEATDSSGLVISDEIRTVLLSGGKAYMAQARHLDKPAIWSPLMALFQRQITLLRGAADRGQSSANEFRFVPDWPNATYWPWASGYPPYY